MSDPTDLQRRLMFARHQGAADAYDRVADRLASMTGTAYADGDESRAEFLLELRAWVKAESTSERRVQNLAGLDQLPEEKSD